MFLWQLISVLLSILVFSQAFGDGASSVTANEVCKDDSTIKRSLTQTINNRPYPTMSSAKRPYCFREHNENSHYLTFDIHEWQEALDILCGHSTLSPGDGFRSYVSPKGLVVWGAYAQDQSGCSKKSSFDFAQSCTKWMDNLVQTCDGPISDKGFHGHGGGFIQSEPSGCIEYYIAKSSNKAT